MKKAAGNRPNVVVIVLDTARAFNFSCYGYGKETSPHIDAVAKEGVLFQNAVSPSPWTLPAHASLFTGMYPCSHGCTEKHKMLGDGTTVLPEVLKGIGYRTVGISNNSWISRSFGFDRGFDIFINLWQLVQCETDFADPSAKGMDKYRKAAGLLMRGNPLVNLLNGIYGRFFWRRYDYGARRINRIVGRLLKNDLGKGQPFFLFINYLEPHLEYKAPEPYWGRFLPEGVAKRDALSVNQDAWAYMGGLVPMGEADRQILTALYDGEIAYLDHRIGELCGMLRRGGMLDDTLLILTSDHGENILDHGLMDHQYCLYDTLLKVPLVLRLPSYFEGGKSAEAVVQTTDIFPTVMEVLGIETEVNVQGRSLLRANTGRLAYSEYAAPQPGMEAIYRKYPAGNFHRFDRSLLSVRRDNWKFISASDGKEELYDLGQDPFEENDVAGSVPEVESALRAACAEWKERYWSEDAAGTEASMSGEIRKRLEALGYFN